MRRWLVLACSWVLACDRPATSGMDATAGDVTATDAAPDADRCATLPAAQMKQRYDGTAFWDAPFPSTHRQRVDGTWDLAGIPDPWRTPYLAQLETLVQDDAPGAAVSAGIFFDATEALDPASITLATRPRIVQVPRTAGGATTAVPTENYRVLVEGSRSPFGPTHPLVLLPLPGLPLAADAPGTDGTFHVAWVPAGLRDGCGRAVQPSEAVRAMREGRTPGGLDPTLAARVRDVLPLDTTLAFTVFRTRDPKAVLARTLTAALTDHPLQLQQPLSRTEVHPGFCVYEGRVTVPVYQQGTPPYADTGGGWRVDAGTGIAAFQRSETARIVVTVPRSARPAEGWPVVYFVRTGGGGDRPLVDRGRQGRTGGPALEPGTGPAQEFARVGFAGVSVDGPHGGLRNVTGGDEQYLVFNVGNPIAGRDNVRQSALEIAMEPAFLRTLTLDTTDCDGATQPSTGPLFDLAHLALMGHSTGATIAQLVMPVQPAYRTVLLSGAGASYVENILWKLRPIAVRPIALGLLGYTGRGIALTSSDFALTLLQWGGETSEGPNLGPFRAADGQRGPPNGQHVLMMQGIVDHYILPPIAAATVNALGLDRAGPRLELSNAELIQDARDPDWYSDSAPAITAPVQGNRNAGMQTAVTVQYPEDGVEDGHEVVFQTGAPKRAYRCFLASWRTGVPRLPAPASTDDAPCMP